MHDALHYDITLDRLLGALPELSELSVLRHALLGASVVDLTRLWSHSSAYATYDKRVLSHVALERAIAAAAQVSHARIEQLYQALARMLTALSANDLDAAAAEALRM